MLRDMVRSVVTGLRRFKDGTQYRTINPQGTLVREPRKLRGKAAVKAAKRMRRA